MATEPTGEQLEQLSNILHSSFSYDSLLQFARYKLELDMESIIPVKDQRDLRQVVSQLVYYSASKKGGLKQLLTAAYQYHPNNVSLATLIDKWTDLDFEPITLPKNELSTGIGDRSIVVSKEVESSVIVTGDNNSINYAKTDGGASIQGNLDIGHTFIGRDKHVHGDEIGRDKIEVDGDYFSAGENAHNVTVGKNIIQIIGNRLNIPSYFVIPLIVIAISSVVGIILVQRQTQWVGAIFEVISAPTPTPTQTPIPTPPIMPKGGFNIAVAAFQDMNRTGEIEEQDGFREVASTVANYLANQKDEIESIIRQRVVVWGPTEGVKAVIPGTERQQANALNADVLLYGQLQQLDTQRWKLKPQFFLTDEVVHSASELYGEHALGTQIAYRPDNAASIADINQTLQVRLEALTQILMGLSYYVYGTKEGYAAAANIFDQATRTDWALATDNTGQEVLYLFQGNAYLKLATLSEDNPTIRQEDLLKSKNAYELSLQRNHDYGRAYNGLGSVLFQLARPISSATDECDWEWHQVAEAGEKYAQALQVQPVNKPASGQVNLRGYLGLGRVRYWQGYCGERFPPKEWSEALGYYESALTEYKASANPLFDLEAALIYSDMGFMALIQADQLLSETDAKTLAQANTLLAKAASDYQQAFDLATNYSAEEGNLHALSIIPYYLTVLCLQNNQEGAKAALEKLLSKFPESDQLRSKILSNVPTWKECTS